MACGATYALVPFVNSKALGGVAGIVGAGGNVGAVLAGFLMKGTGDVRQTLIDPGRRWCWSRALRARRALRQRRASTTPAGRSMKEAAMKLIVIGHGMVGHKFLETLFADAGAATFDVTVLCEEPRPAYDRVHLSEFFRRQDGGRPVAGRAGLLRARQC